MITLFFWISVGMYAVAGGVIAYRYLNRLTVASLLSWWMVAVAWGIQGYVQLGRFADEGWQLEVNLSASLELVSWVTALLYLVGWRVNRHEARSVGLLLLPLVVVLLVGARLLPGSVPDLKPVDALLVTHLGISLLAYGLFSVAAVLALLESLQERSLKSKRPHPLLVTLPSLDRLEERLFLMLRFGFVLLTLSMVTGAVFSHEHSGHWLILNHKVVFSWITWILFGTLLVGRHWRGWRGRYAVRLTLWGYLCLVLGYLGVKFVAQVLLSK
ncbi:MAG: cytochrome c biogenesis protein CcsA [Magnetococcales bacterium]|nr:cytochrome c biogenesis protein CcsA [Magnetococcales bacterium]MBF0157585.1 cytochrome c biogenesis protein CcsA [Magnetococcales bacterium]